jgi:hypothetical protein
MDTHIALLRRQGKSFKFGKAQSIAQQARRSRQLGVAMAGIYRQARVPELIAKLTGQLDESARVAVLIQEREDREKAQIMRLERLTLDERVELAGLLTKAEGGTDPEIKIRCPDENSRG